MSLQSVVDVPSKVKEVLSKSAESGLKSTQKNALPKKLAIVIGEDPPRLHLLKPFREKKMEFPLRAKTWCEEQGMVYKRVEVFSKMPWCSTCLRRKYKLDDIKGE